MNELPSSIVEEAIHSFTASIQFKYFQNGGCVVEMKGKIIFIVCLLSALLIAAFMFFSVSASRMDAPHAQVKEYFLDQLQQAIDNNEDEISYRTDRYQRNGVQYIGEIYVISNKKDIKYVKDILSHCKAIMEVRQYPPTNIHVFVGGIDIGCTGPNGDYYWSVEEGKSLGFDLSEKYNEKLWKFLDTFDYHIAEEVGEGSNNR